MMQDGAYGLVWLFELHKRRKGEEEREDAERLMVRTSKGLFHS
jgi:hypothetical protein